LFLPGLLRPDDRSESPELIFPLKKFFDRKKTIADNAYQPSTIFPKVSSDSVSSQRELRIRRFSSLGDQTAYCDPDANNKAFSRRIKERFGFKSEEEELNSIRG
jgi:hypothetical protein